MIQSVGIVAGHWDQTNTIHVPFKMYVYFHEGICHILMSVR